MPVRCPEMSRDDVGEKEEEALTRSACRAVAPARGRAVVERHRRQEQGAHEFEHHPGEQGCAQRPDGRKCQRLKRGYAAAKQPLVDDSCGKCEFEHATIPVSSLGFGFARQNFTPARTRRIKKVERVARATVNGQKMLKLAIPSRRSPQIQ
ncbi:hypothetical protein SBBP2_840006 [Burkholderiales bacterium]|nr:hypothetical protein SBBP2_840006 [Burkholderiales bacterium]